MKRILLDHGCLRRSLLIGRLHPNNRGGNKESYPPVHLSNEPDRWDSQRRTLALVSTMIIQASGGVCLPNLLLSLVHDRPPVSRHLRLHNVSSEVGTSYTRRGVYSPLALLFYYPQAPGRRRDYGGAGLTGVSLPSDLSGVS